VARIVEVFGNCRVVAQVASGPLTDVYHAVQEPLGRHVAVKALRPTMSPDSPFAVPLVREAELLSRLSHANVLTLYDFVRTEDAMWLVLEYVDGLSVADLLSKLERLGVQSTAAVGIEIARALAHAHDRGIVHRDVKPSNVLLSLSGRVKLVDFGIARDDRGPSAPETLEAGSTYGTPAYMSPEQILGEPIDLRTDLFSLGIVLYQLVAGKRPFEAPDTKTTAQRIRHDDPPALSSVVADVPRAFERIVDRCLEKLPGDRFASAVELATELEGFLRSQTQTGTTDLLLGELVRAKVIDQLPRLREPQQSFAGPAARSPLASAVRVYGAILLMGLLGATLIQNQARKTDEGASIKQGPLELLPSRAGWLRVVARPWADVIVDGQKVETTPFAHPVPLSAGVHYVTLKHPKARNEERRVIKIIAGQTLLLDVAMGVADRAPAIDAGAEKRAPEPGETEDAGPPTP
jgi:eukaryotic-like serine/threonine-protein kinase